MNLLFLYSHSTIKCEYSYLKEMTIIPKSTITRFCWHLCKQILHKQPCTWQWYSLISLQHLQTNKKTTIMLSTLIENHLSKMLSNCEVSICSLTNINIIINVFCKRYNMACTCTFNFVTVSLPPPKSYKCKGLTAEDPHYKITRYPIIDESWLSLDSNDTDTDVCTFQWLKLTACMSWHCSFAGSSPIWAPISMEN